MRVEPAIIIKTLKKNHSKIRQTAKELDISPGTLINWRKRATTGTMGLREAKA